MLTALRLGNFKAFGETQTLPLKPLTLIFGPNSGGKSSLIHGLLLARCALETGDLDAHRTAIGGDSVDLGGFRQYVHRRDLTNPRGVECASELDVRYLTGRLAELLRHVKTVRVSISIWPEIREERNPTIEVGGWPGSANPRLVTYGDPQMQMFEVYADDALLLRMNRTNDNKYRIYRLEHQNTMFRDVLEAIVLTSTTAQSVTAADIEAMADTIDELLPNLRVSYDKDHSDKLLPTRVSLMTETDAARPSLESVLLPVGRTTRNEDLAAAVRVWLPRVLDDLIHGLSDAVSRELRRLHYLGPLRSYPPRHLAFSQHHDPNWLAGGGFAWDEVRRNEDVRKNVNEWLGSEERLQTRYELVVRDLVGIEQVGDRLEGILQLSQASNKVMIRWS